MNSPVSSGVDFTVLMAVSTLLLMVLGAFLLAILGKSSTVRSSLRDGQDAIGDSNRLWTIVAAGLAGGILVPLILAGIGVTTVFVAPLMLIILATIVGGLIFLSRTPAGRWTLAAFLLTAVPLLAMIGMFGVRQVRTVEYQNAENQVAKSHQTLVDAELRERPTESASGPRENSPSTEIPVADSPPDNEATEPVSYVERVYEPKLQRMVSGRNGGQPDWLRDLTYGSSTTQNQSHVTSERFATIDEARAQLFGKLLPQLEQDLKLREPRVGNWKPNLAQIEESGIIEREAVATYQLEVGEFNEPVHEVTWVYDLHRDASMGQLLRHWQRSITADRIPMVLAVLAGMAVLFAIASGVLYRSGRDTTSSSPRQRTLA